MKEIKEMDKSKMMPIAPMMIEHRLIERMIEVMRAELDRFLQEKKADPELILTFVDFVRTYADHLGLESEKMVQRFKEEAAGFQSRADLHFPAPLPEGKIPSGAVLVMLYSGYAVLLHREAARLPLSAPVAEVAQ